MSVFTDDTAVEPAGDGRWRGELTDRWQTPGGTPNGGYVLAVAARAMAATLPHPHPASITGHFIAPPAAGPTQLEVEVVRAGKRHSTATCRLVQDGREVLRTLATFTDLSRADGPTHVAESPPPLPPREECKRINGSEYPDAPTLLQRFDWATPEEFLGFMRGEKTGRGVNGGWIRFADADETDPLAPVLLADAFAPPVFNLEDDGSRYQYEPTQGAIQRRGERRHRADQHERDRRDEQRQQLLLLPGPARSGLDLVLQPFLEREPIGEARQEVRGAGAREPFLRGHSQRLQNERHAAILHSRGGGPEATIQARAEIEG
ncbi:MAG: thioesterase family protein, partial [Actinobacteria bacterium]|nr:thioesterase family protein [Actinomycetota bacterium]